MRAGSRACGPTTSPRSRSASSRGAIPNLAEKVEDVFFGSANQAGEDNRNLARMALLLAGLPESVPGVTVNRLCASGMDAVAPSGAGDQGGRDFPRDRGRLRIDDARAVRHGQG